VSGARPGRSARVLALLITVIAIVPGVALPIEPLPAQSVRREFTELHMGVAVRIVLYAPNDSTAREAARAAFARIAALEAIMSDYRPASELRRLSGAAPGRPIAISAEMCDVLRRALEIARASGGGFDPTIGPLVALWRDTRRTGALPAADELAPARSRVGWRRVHLDGSACTVALEPGTQLDLGGIAKGYIVDQALATLAERGVGSALIEAGGDIVVGDAPPGTRGWRIAVPHADPSLATRAASLVNAAISTSGDSEQFVEIGGRRYSHIIDPRTGVGTTAGTLATVIARDGATADALATALAVLGPSGSAELIGRHPSAIAAVRSTEIERRGRGPP
jgi:thiamine biosynthesis lipoprotein